MDAYAFSVGADGHADLGGGAQTLASRWALPFVLCSALLISHRRHSHRLVRPDPVAMDPSHAPSFAVQLAAALTRLGFDDQHRQTAGAAGGAAPLGVNAPRSELVRELEWVEDALGQLRPEQSHALATLLQALHARHALTSQQMNTSVDKGQRTNVQRPSHPTARCGMLSCMITHRGCARSVRCQLLPC